MKYTISKEADLKIEEDMKKIKEIIIKEFNPISIVLFGGFGHEGGSFKIKNGKKEIIPLNDYDLYIITKEKISEEKLEIIGKECSKKIKKGGKEFVENFNEKYEENEFFHVDLHNIIYKNLKKLYPTQRAFDLKTSLIIWGDKNILKKIPNIKISKSDALRLLFNKLDHFSIAEKNSKEIKSIYAVKGFTDLLSALLIFEGKYISKYQDREKELKKLNIPKELKESISKATKAKLYTGYKIKDVDDFFKKSKKWVSWTLKKLIKEYLKIGPEENWKIICKKMYKKLPYKYFNDYLGNKYLFLGQYYLNIRFFISGLRKKELLIRSLIRWRDAGLIIAISLILYCLGEEKESEKYLRKITNKTSPLKNRILKLYSIYYLQKLI